MALAVMKGACGPWICQSSTKRTRVWAAASGGATSTVSAITMAPSRASSMVELLLVSAAPRSSGERQLRIPRVHDPPAHLGGVIVRPVPREQAAARLEVEHADVGDGPRAPQPVAHG